MKSKQYFFLEDYMKKITRTMIITILVFSLVSIIPASALESEFVLYNNGVYEIWDSFGYDLNFAEFLFYPSIYPDYELNFTAAFYTSTVLSYKVDLQCVIEYSDGTYDSDSVQGTYGQSYNTLLLGYNPNKTIVAIYTEAHYYWNGMYQDTVQADLFF